MKRGKFINFELLLDTSEDISSLVKNFEPELIKCKEENVKTVFALYLLEGILPYDQKHCIEYFQKIKKISDDLNIEIILISGLGENFFNVSIPFKVYFTSFMLRLCANNLKFINFDNSKKENKFLFLGGVPTRSNRILLLSKFYDSGLLKSSEWSFFYPPLDEDRFMCRKLLPHYTDEIYDKFLKDCERSVDSKYKEIINYFRDSNAFNPNVNWSDITKTEFWKNPIYIDPKIYNNTKFSILSEGCNEWTNNYNFITEKTWRTILYKHPFIFAGPPDQFTYIKSLGFKTFEEYLPIKDYAYISDEDTRLNAIVFNTKYLLNENHHNSLQADAEYNFQLFLKYAKEQDIFLNNLKVNYNISDSNFDRYFNVLGFENLI